MLSPPALIAGSGNPGAALGYPWDLAVARAIKRPLPDEHPRLTQAYWSCNLRAGFGVALATAEWVVWRYQGMVALDDPLHRLSAGYLALRTPALVRIDQPGDDFPDEMQDAHGPLMLLRMLLAYAWDAYHRESGSVHAVGVSLALLARHVCPRPEPFEDWASACLRRCHQEHPNVKRPLAEQPPLRRSFFFDDAAPQPEPGAAYAGNPYVLAQPA